MALNLSVGDKFPDLELPNQQGKKVRLSNLTAPGLLDQHLGFRDGYPLIVAFGRGFFCPRDQEHLRHLVGFQSELKVNFGRLVTISADPPLVQAAFRAGLGADWPFLSDENLEATRQLDILDETEGEYAYRAQPFTFVLCPDLSLYKIYNGWYYVGRPTPEELRQDLRAIMKTLSYYPYQAWNQPEVKAVRIPQQEWVGGAPLLGQNGLPVAQGTVRWFDLNSGNGGIVSENSSEEVFFNFTAIPGQGYRTLRPGIAVAFEMVQGRYGLSARNIQVISL
ncbi:MAG: cold shock domain-containing protein [Thermaceae bacterium]|nr:cold shock domain-containing protein [Thermaceae bacterium]